MPDDFNLETSQVFGDVETGYDEVLVNLARLPFVRGQQIFSRKAELEYDGDIEKVIPADGEVVRRYDSKETSILLLSGDGWTAVIERHSWSPSMWAGLSATSFELARKLADHFESFNRQPQEDHLTVPVRLWHLSGDGVRSFRKQIKVDSWSDIDDNYPPKVAKALDRLMTMTEPPGNGRLLLWHGPPGTGKTTAIRSLAHTWRPWAHTSYVVDPERFFNDAGYLLQVLTEEDEAEPNNDERPRLIVIEDADQFLSSRARQEAGNALGRLLNLTDGIAGQGLQAFILITTNEPLERLHPAITRPGRCLANIEFGKFSRQEALEWLGAGSGVPSDGLTLAQLFAMRDETAQVVHTDESSAGGQYL